MAHFEILQLTQPLAEMYLKLLWYYNKNKNLNVSPNTFSLDLSVSEGFHFVHASVSNM